MNKEKLLRLLNQPIWRCPVAVEAKDVRIYIEVKNGSVIKVSTNIEDLDVKLFIIDYDENEEPLIQLNHEETYEIPEEKYWK